MPHEIICEACGNSTLFKINNENKKITLENCKNNHTFKDIKLKDFLENQRLYETNLKCQNCGNFKNYYNEDFLFTSEDKNICTICSKLYNNEITMIEYNKKYYNCNKHYLEYISYCSFCHVNLCEKCEIMHNNNKNHQIISFKSLKKTENKIDEIKNEIEEKISKIKLYKHILQGLREFFNEAN